MSWKIFSLFLLILALGEAKIRVPNFPSLKIAGQPRIVEDIFRDKRSVEDVADTSGEAKAIKEFVAETWTENKLENLVGLADALGDSGTNLSIVGWQKILNPDGSVKEVKSILLVIPPKPNASEEGGSSTSSSSSESTEDDSRVIPHDDIKEIRQAGELLNELGIPTSATFETHDEKGKIKNEFYLDVDELYFSVENFTIYNKTVTATKPEVEEFIKNLQPTSLGTPTILRFNGNGELTSNRTLIDPLLLGNVFAFEEVSDEILIKSPKAIAVASQLTPRQEIPKNLAKFYAEQWPEYKWRVLVNPSDSYVTYNVSVTLTYDNFDFYETSNNTYYVYGALRDNATPK